MLDTETFLSTLISTNKSHSFFTNWEKVNKNRNAYKDELALLGVMSGASDPHGELKRLIEKYPRINELIPLLSAVRIKSTNKLLTILDEDNMDDIQYYFGPDNLTSQQIGQSIQFAEKTGLIEQLTKIKNHADYYLGVETGLDSNARKNRSGTAMEQLTENYVRDFTTKHQGRYLIQTNFAKASKEFGVEAPANQVNKRGDFMILVGDQPINIETNFFDGGGSKQEIMNSYISRAEDLQKAGWKFILVTDGLGWRQSKNQVDYGYKTIKNIVNLTMCKNGALEEILQ